MMRINNYDFGRIVIHKKEYNRDLIVFADKVIPNWQRKEGHSLNVEDLKDVLEFNPEVIVVGTGFYGVMEVPKKTKDFVEKRGIKLIVQKTSQAYKTFNELTESGEKIVGCFHLTC